MPNPFNDVLHISRIDLGGEVNIQISDMEGKIIFKEQINTNANLPNNKIEIFTENYLSGMYIWWFRMKSKQSSKGCKTLMTSLIM